MNFIQALLILPHHVFLCILTCVFILILGKIRVSKDLRLLFRVTAPQGPERGKTDAKKTHDMVKLTGFLYS